MSQDSQRLTRRLDAARRPVMKAIGAGAILGGLGLATTGADDAANALDEHEGTVHTVETLISVPPTAEDRPADFFYQPTGLHVEPGDVVRWRFVTPDHNVVSLHPAFGMRRRIPLGVDAFSSPLLGFEPDSIPGDMIEPPTPPAEESDGGPGNETTTMATETTAETETLAETETTVEGNATTAEPPAQTGPVPSTWLLEFETPGVYDIVCSPHEAFGMAMRIVVGDETETEFETSDPEALPEPRAGPVGLSRVTLTDPALEPDAIVEAGTVEWQDLEAVPAPGGDGDDGEGDGDDGEGDGDDGEGEGTETVGA